MDLIVRDVIERRAELDNGVATVDGFIFVHWNPSFDEDAGIYDDFYLAPTQDDFTDKTRCIYLDCPALYLAFQERNIRMKAGGRNGGGIWDRCQARGRVVDSSNNLFPVALCDLECLRIWKDPNKKGLPMTIAF